MKSNSKLIITSIFLMLVMISTSAMSHGSAPMATTTSTTFQTVDVVISFTQPVDFAKMFPQVNVYREYHNINAVAASIPTVLLGFLEKQPWVKAIEYDHEFTVLQDTLDWGVDKINAEVVWGGSENAVDVASGRYAGDGVKVAVIDTGIDYTHPDLDNNYYGGYDFVNDDSDPKDDNGHGTHVAGIIAAEDNGVGVIGVAPHAQLYAVKVLNSQGSGTYSDIVAGIDWAIDNNMDIISMSLGGSSGDTALQDALQRAYDAGIVIVAASGNDYANSISYPAKYDTVIAVGATDSSDNRAAFSNYGPELEVVAPGVDIYSTYLGGGYETLSGTSMATPMVSGVVALMLSKNPNLTPAEVRQILHDTALDLGASGWDQYYGYGRVQADAAVNAVSGGGGGDTTPPSKVTGLTVTTVSSTQLDLSWDPVPDSDLSYYKIYRDGVYIGQSTTTSYSDTGLSPGTTYTYEVSAVDTSGNEGPKSDPVSGTTEQSSGNEYTMYVYSIDMWYERFSFWFWRWYDVYIKVTVHDGNGNALAGVTVYLDLELPSGSVASGNADTGTDGTVTFKYDNGPGGTYTATVTNLVKTGYTYTPDNNVETSDSIYVS